MSNALLISGIKVAFLDDDLSFASEICRELRHLGYDVTHFSTGQSCLNDLMAHDYDLCIFDSNLPDMSGPKVMERLQKNGRMPPVIFMTGNDEEREVTQVLLAGADDYIIKPPVISVLHARMQALLRRSQPPVKQDQNERLGQLTIDYTNKVVFRNGSLVSLTGSETQLIFEFFTHRGQIVSREVLYSKLGAHQMAIDTRRIDVHISHLRQKLGLSAENGWKLTSIYQRGYRLEYLNQS